MEEKDKIIVKWVQEDVETSNSLLNNNNNNNNNNNIIGMIFMCQALTSSNMRENQTVKAKYI